MICRQSWPDFCLVCNLLWDVNWNTSAWYVPMPLPLSERSPALFRMDYSGKDKISIESYWGIVFTLLDWARRALTFALIFFTFLWCFLTAAFLFLFIFFLWFVLGLVRNYFNKGRGEIQSLIDIEMCLKPVNSTWFSSSDFHVKFRNGHSSIFSLIQHHIPFHHSFQKVNSNEIIL